MTRGRYAPSPTGALHLGNARTALVAYWQAHAGGGAFVMRAEDLDSARSRPEKVEENLSELRWLGLDWDEGPDVGGPHAPYRQSERHALYEAALERLEAEGHLFACYLSRKDLREVASAPHGEMSPYGARERALNARLRSEKQAAGKTPSLRFRVNGGRVCFHDRLQGKQCAQPGDFVVRRADGEWAYQLAVVVDDIAMRIDEVVRGDDLLGSTAAQLLLYEALDASPPDFLHVPLLLEPSGERMAKRKGSLTLSALAARGVRPERVVGLLAYSLGLISEPAELSVGEGLERYDLERLNREPFALSEAQLEWLAL